MTLNISATSPRVQYTVGSSSTTTFAYGFPIFQDADLKVFVGSTLKTLTTHYTVTGAGTTSGGNVVMTTGNEVTNADVTIVRDITIARTTDFPTSGSFQVDSLNTELDTITAVQQELEDDISRSLKLSDEDATATLTLPLKDARKGRYLAFNATTGNAEAGPTQTDATLIATVTTDIATLADLQDGTTLTNGLSNLAGKVTEMGRLGTADAVADMALLGTTDVVADMALLAVTDVISDMALLANADVISDMNTLATSDIIADLNTLATSDIVTDMNLLATSANVTAMANLGTSTNVTNMANLNASGVIANINTLSGILSGSQTFVITVVSSGGNKFAVDGSTNPTLSLIQGHTYTFDQTASTNDGHPLAFKDSSGNSFTTGVTYELNGASASQSDYYNVTTFNAGRSSGDRKVILTVPSSGTQPARYYCTVHGNGMGNTITTRGDDIAQVANVATEVGLLGTSAVVEDMGFLGTSANVTAMGLLGTSAVVEDMGFLGTSANVTAMGHLGTSANVTAMGLLGTSAVVEDMGFLGTSANVGHMATLGASGVVANIATVATDIANVNTVASNIGTISTKATKGFATAMAIAL